MFLVLSIVGNMGMLATFKYMAFTLNTINGIFDFIGYSRHLPVLTPKLPIGISFYTFMALSYTIDIYRGRIKPTGNFLHFLSFLSMFPHLVAGPIVRAEHLLPQMLKCAPSTKEQRWEGTKLIVGGYFKKVVIADNISGFVDTAFNVGAGNVFHSGPFWWITMVMFTFQIYCDFSGYSDIARGLARWMGYDFKLNFDHPYISLSFREFWNRWHISLSTWFRDYVYIPLGGSKKGKLRLHINLLITMLVSGLWHGASWTFVLWGAFHSAFLSIERLTKWPKRVMAIPGGKIIVSSLIFSQVLLAWVFFRANTIDQAFEIFQTMFDINMYTNGAAFSMPDKQLFFVAIGILMDAYFWLGLDRAAFNNTKLYKVVEFVVVAIMINACVFLRGAGNAFVYFQF